MNKDRVKGKVDEVVGSAKRQFGNATGDSSTEIKGAVQQLKGKVETAVGNLKQAAHDAQVKSPAPRETDAEAERRRR